MRKEIKNLVFDVNETLLDLTPLKDSINLALGSKNAAEIWFSQLLHYSLVETVTGHYRDFSELAAAVFQMNAHDHNKNFSDEEVNEILKPITKLGPYPDVMKGLNALRESGFHLLAFSNGKPDVLKKQLEYSGLNVYFNKIFSVDACRKYKPHPDAYNYVLETGSLVKEETMMVAAHGWDIAGAQRAGLKTAFIQRPGKQIFPLAEKPTIETSNISTLAEELIKL